MKDPLESLVPIFIDVEGERFSLLGTGVLISFRGEFFILTAGHVIDGFSHGQLAIPFSERREIGPIEGVYSYIKPDTPRTEDYLDFGYFKLDKGFANEVRELFYAIPESEFGVRNNYRYREPMSFAGYPHRKHNVAGGVASTKDYVYTGYHAGFDDYQALGCLERTNLVAKFNRKNTVNRNTGMVNIAPLPHGISGGGVFVWPTPSLALVENDRRLIGIGHSYVKDGGYLIGTRLEIVLSAILKNNPALQV